MRGDGAHERDDSNGNSAGSQRFVFTPQRHKEECLDQSSLRLKLNEDHVVVLANCVYASMFILTSWFHKS